MKLKKTEKGQILYIIAIALVALMAFTGLAVDGSTVYRARRTDQSAADAAALAGAGAAANYLKTYPGFTCGSTIDAQGQSLARARAVTAAAVFKTSNGDPVTLVNGDLSSGNGVVTSCATNANGAAYITIQVKVSSAVNTYFFKVVSRTPIQTNVAATTKVTSSTLGSILNGTGMISLSSSGCGMDITSTPVKITGGGIFDNSDLCSNWAPNVNTTACIGVAGSVGSNYTNGSQTITGPGFCNPQVAQITSSAVQTMFSAIPGAPSTPSCSTYKQWTWSQILAGGAGVYCFPTNKSLNLSYQDAGNGANVTQTINGTVTLVFSGSGSFTINGGTYLTLNFGGLEIFIQNGSFDAGGTYFAVPNTFRLYMIGTNKNSTVTFDGGSTDVFGDAFFYMGNGDFYLPGSINFQATAPQYGPYKGILVYQPITNTQTMEIHGGSNFNSVGSILAPGATIQLNGSTNTAVLNSQLVGNKITVAGGSTINIHYDSGVNYAGSGQPLTIDVLH
ncbi:MAG: hypothetical protein GYA58_12450 [Anaerolineaceae bacterium]|nr:hypothetical protein [Anaerolineaceae bacterium]